MLYGIQLSTSRHQVSHALIAPWSPEKVCNGLMGGVVDRLLLVGDGIAPCPAKTLSLGKDDHEALRKKSISEG